MLKACLEVFQKQLDKKGINLILDNYVPKDGTYVLLSLKGEGFGEPRVVEIKKDKKSEEILGQTDSHFKKICEYDLYSKLQDVNKPIDSNKIIHSINYCSFYVKKESLKNGKLTEEVIKHYYDVLKNPVKKYKGKKKSLELYLDFEEKNGRISIENLEKAKKWIQNNIFQMDSWMSLEGKDYLKIIFEFPVEVFEKEFRRYIIPNIYNKNDFNVEVKQQILGLSNQNMGMNPKKPYLENKSKKLKVPYLISGEEAILQMLFFEYLLSFADFHKQNVYIDPIENTIEVFSNKNTPKCFSGYYLRIQKAKEVEIHYFDVISGFSADLEPKFTFNNYLQIENTGDYQYGRIGKRSELEKVLEKVFFTFLSNNYFTDESDIALTDHVECSAFLIARRSLFNWFYKGDFSQFCALHDRLTLLLLKQSIRNNRWIKAAHQLNLRWSLKQYFKGGEEKMADILLQVKQDLKTKMYEKETKQIKSDIEYYFSVGQLAYYLLSKNRGKSIPQSLINGFLNIKTDQLLKDNLRKLYVRYNYDLTLKEKRFNNLYAMINGYTPDTPIDQDILIAGFLSSNLFYEKKEENE